MADGRHIENGFPKAPIPKAAIPKICHVTHLPQAMLRW